MNSRLLENVSISAPFARLGLNLEPVRGGTLVWSEELEEKAFQRAVAILKGYLALACAGGAETVGPEDLPEQAGPEALMAVWYERSVHAGSLRGRLSAAYNAFGALPGGFPALGENMERWLGKEVAGKLTSYVNLARQEDDEGETGPACLPEWSSEELEAVEQGVLRAVREGFSA